MNDITSQLTEPFPPEAISWRIGSLNKDKTKAMALAYVDARDVMDRLDAVCGSFGWQSEHVVTGDMVTCHIRIRDPETGEWITKSDGAGKTEVEGEKGSYSDSLKRAAVAWGVARYLYSTISPWVVIEPYGRSYRIADSEKAKLLSALPRPATRRPTGAHTAAAAPPPPPNGEAPLTPAEKAAYPNDRERRAKAATEAKRRITEALGVARTPALIDEIVSLNSAYLKEIKALHEPAYLAIMQLAGRLKTEMYGETG